MSNDYLLVTKKKLHSEKGEVEWALFLVALAFAGLLSVAFMSAGCMRKEQIRRMNQNKADRLRKQHLGLNEVEFKGPQGYQVVCNRSKVFGTNCR